MTVMLHLYLLLCGYRPIVISDSEQLVLAVVFFVGSVFCCFVLILFLNLMSAGVASARLLNF